MLVDKVSEIGKQKWQAPENLDNFLQSKAAGSRVHVVPRLAASESCNSKPVWQAGKLEEAVI